MDSLYVYGAHNCSTRGVPRPRNRITLGLNVEDSDDDDDGDDGDDDHDLVSWAHNCSTRGVSRRRNRITLLDYNDDDPLHLTTNQRKKEKMT